MKKGKFRNSSSGIKQKKKKLHSTTTQKFMKLNLKFKTDSYFVESQGAKAKSRP